MNTAVPRPALMLGLAGLIPFYAGLALAASADATTARLGLVSFTIYASVILSFLGGARWGLELARAPDAPSMVRLIWSVLPSIAGWLLCLWVTQGGGAYEASLFAGCFAAQYVWDRAAGREGLAPAWYPRLRLYLTIGVLVACLAMPIAGVLDVG